MTQPIPELPKEKQSVFKVLSDLLFNPHLSITDISNKRRARLTAILSFILTLLLGIGILFHPTAQTTFLIISVIALLSYLLSRTKHHFTSALLLSFGILVNAFLPLYFGTASTFLTSVYTIVPLAFILANALLPIFGQILITIMGVLATILSPLYSDMVPPDLVASTTGVLMSFGLILISLGHFRTNTENIRLEETQQINLELENIKKSLERRVKDRTLELQKRASQLAAIADVARTIASLQDMDQLLSYTTQIVSEHFGFYHTGIYLLSEDKEYAVLRATNSESRQAILVRDHQLSVRQEGLVSFAINQKKARIALDVGDGATHFDNPDLPDTRSEMVLPLMIGEDVIGVLDVHSEKPNAFSNEDIEVLDTLANQAAVAIENARLFANVQFLAATDELTNLHNRRHFHDIANIEFNRGRRYKRALSAMMLDIDHFKKVNDTYGHLVGDQLLQVVAKQCKQSLRNTDILGRYGGEEFVILLPETELETAKTVAERLRKNISEALIPTEKGDISVTISIGIAENNELTPTLETLIARADQAMYIAKHKGRNRVAISI